MLVPPFPHRATIDTQGRRRRDRQREAGVAHRCSTQYSHARTTGRQRESCSRPVELASDDRAMQVARDRSKGSNRFHHHTYPSASSRVSRCMHGCICKKPICDLTAQANNHSNDIDNKQANKTAIEIYMYRGRPRGGSERARSCMQVLNSTNSDVHQTTSSSLIMD